MVLHTPVVILGYNRPEMTKRVFAAVAQAQPQELFLVMDGPRDSVPGDARRVEAVREVVQQVDWPCRVSHIFSPTNLGLKERVVSGLDSVFRETDRAIILEDDCVPDETFFRFCEDMLERYSSSPDVALISGSSRLRGRRAGPYSYDFSADLRIWGWASWGRTWQAFRTSGDLDASWSESERAHIIARAARGARRRSMKRMLEGASALDSWALPFAVYFQKSDNLSIVPEVNLVENIGFGAMSTHTQFEDFVSHLPARPLLFPLNHPPRAAHNPALDQLESRLDAREWWLFPLHHPLDVAKRVWRYAILRFRSRWRRFTH